VIQERKFFYEKKLLIKCSPKEVCTYTILKDISKALATATHNTIEDNKRRCHLYE
jgi:hypothetical protein